MYRPAPPRRKKTRICRSREGCYTCRRRHRKCDLARPTCSNCAHRGLECDGYALRLTWLPASVGTGDNPQRPKRKTSSQKSASSATALSRAAPSPLLHTESPLTALSWLQGFYDTNEDDDIQSQDLLIRAVSQEDPSRGFLLQDHEVYLLNYFDRCVRKSLLHLMGDWLAELAYHPFLETALLAVSASSLFQNHIFQRESTSASCLVKERQVNSLTHSCFQLAVNYYNDAIRTINNTTSAGNKSPLLTLAATLLLVLFEWESGSVHGSFIHMDGADAIVLASQEQLCKTSTGCLLLESWASMRARKNRQKLVFRPLEVELSRASDPQASILSMHALQFSSGLAFPLTDAYLLRNRLILQMCAACDGIDHSCLLDHFRHWYSQAFSFAYPDESPAQDGNALTTNELLSGLDATRRVLRKWHSNLNKSQLPFTPSSLPFAVDQSLEGQLIPFEPVVPITFQTPEAAFDYLRYSISIVMTSPQVMGMYVLATQPRAPGTFIPAIVAHLLSVIEGLNPAQLAYYDMYDSGPLWVLVTLALCVPEIHIVSWILDVILPKFEKHMHQGSILINLIHAKKMLACIRLQLQDGILPLLCSTSSLITEDLISSPVARFGQRFVVIGRNASGSYQRIVTNEPQDMC